MPYCRMLRRNGFVWFMVGGLEWHPEKRINLNSLTNWCVTESDFPYIIVADLPLGPVSLFAHSKITVKMRISNSSHKKVTKLTKKYKQKNTNKTIYSFNKITLHYITKLTRILLDLQNCTSGIWISVSLLIKKNICLFIEHWWRLVPKNSFLGGPKKFFGAWRRFCPPNIKYRFPPLTFLAMDFCDQAVQIRCIVSFNSRIVLAIVAAYGKLPALPPKRDNGLMFSKFGGIHPSWWSRCRLISASS